MNSTDSRRAASRCHAGVITLSTAVMRFDGLFAEIFVARAHIDRKAAPWNEVNASRNSIHSSIQNHGTESTDELRVR
jgi:hypothetical protein